MLYGCVVAPISCWPARFDNARAAADQSSRREGSKVCRLSAPALVPTIYNSVFLIGHFDRGSLRSLPTLGHTDENALALVQMRDACPLQRGRVNEDLLPATIQDDKPKPPDGVVSFHGPRLVDSRFQRLSV